jgi:hypothetical protein
MTASATSERSTGLEAARMLAVLAWVTTATAISLGVLGALPGLLGSEPREVRLVGSVEEAERLLAAPLALPSYYPSRLAWPPAEVRVVGGKGGAASLAFRAQGGHQAELVLLQGTTPGAAIPAALLAGATELSSSRTHIETVPVTRARVLVEGVAWEELRWDRDGCALVLRTRGDVDELVRLARSIHRRRPQ